MMKRGELITARGGARTPAFSRMLWLGVEITARGEKNGGRMFNMKPQCWGPKAGYHESG